MAITVDAELFLVFYTCIFFTLMYFLLGRQRNTKIVLGVLSGLTWITLGLSYVVSVPTTPAIGLLFFGIAMVMIIATVWDSLQLTKEEKEAD